MCKTVLCERVVCFARCSGVGVESNRRGRKAPNSCRTGDILWFIVSWANLRAEVSIWICDIESAWRTTAMIQLTAQKAKHK